MKVYMLVNYKIKKIKYIKIDKTKILIIVHLQTIF